MPQLIVKKEKHTVFLKINNPAKRNVLNAELITELFTEIQKIQQSPDTRLTIISATGKCFCAGADLQWMRQDNSKDTSVSPKAKHLAALLQLIHELPSLTLASIQGDVYGGGLGLAACCDFIFASSSVKFCLPELKLGLIPAVISPYLASRLGHRRSLYLSVCADEFNATQAKQWGLVDELYPEEDFDNSLDLFIKQIEYCAPVAMKACKKLFRPFSTIEINDGVTSNNIALIEEQRYSAEAQEGIQAFFQKRTPQWPE